MKIRRIQPAPMVKKFPEPQELIDLMEKLKSIMQEANNRYLYWDNFKYLKFPKGVQKAVAWHILKLNRAFQSRLFPLQAKNEESFKFWLPDSAQKSLHRIDLEFSGKLGSDDSEMSKTAKHKYIISSIMEEAIASSQLEGAATTRKVAKNLLKTGRKPSNHHEKMILNNYLTMQRTLELAGTELSPDLILELHQLITKGTRENERDEGRFRIDDETSVFGSSNEILHVPPLAKELPERIEKMCAFANSEEPESTFMHPVIKAILLHFWLAYDHPFADGNGRTARAIFYWYMLRKGYWLFEYLSISRIFLNSRGQYEDAYLYAEQDGLDATYFIAYHLRAIEIALKKLGQYIQKKQEEMKRVGLLIRQNINLNLRQRALIRHAIDNPNTIYTIESHRRSFGISYPTARKDLLDMANKDLLITVNEHRYTEFIVPDDLEKRMSDK